MTCSCRGLKQLSRAPSLTFSPSQMNQPNKNSNVPAIQQLLHDYKGTARHSAFLCNLKPMQQSIVSNPPESKCHFLTKIQSSPCLGYTSVYEWWIAYVHWYSGRIKGGISCILCATCPVIRITYRVSELTYDTASKPLSGGSTPCLIQPCMDGCQGPTCP